MKQKDISLEDAIKQVQKMFKKRGTKALEKARTEVLKEKVESLKAQEALNYFMTRYWQDTARPAMLSLACEAVGGDPDATVPIAVPMTLLGGAVDIHDDIIDRSKSKYGRPTVYGKFGRNMALLIGDALLFKGLSLLFKAAENIPQAKMTKIVEVINRAFFQLGDAEALELQTQGSLNLTVEEHLRVIEKKAANVEAHTRIGAIIGGGTDAEIEALGNYGLALGRMLIIQDDVVDMLDAKEFLHRIRYECPPLPVLYALKNPEIRRKLQRLLKGKITRQNAKLLLKMVTETEEVKDLEESIQDLAEECYSQMKNLKHAKGDLKIVVKALIATPKLKRF